MSKKSKDSLTNTPKNKVRKHNLEYFDDSNFETKNINEVTSLLLNSYKTYNGRQFLNDDDLNSVLPSDKIELGRLTLSYILMKHRWKGNFCSPIKAKLNESGTTILDVGCCPGLRAIDMGLKYPSSLIIAIDINHSNFPSSEECPSNDQWIIVIKELVRVLAYDGWIEFTEPDQMAKKGGKNLLWLMDSFSNACREIKDVNIQIYEKIPKYIKEVDELEDLNYTSVDYPLGEWYGCFGEYAAENFKRALQSVVFLPKYMELSNEKFNDLLNDCVEEANKNEAFFKIYKYFAKKRFNYLTFYNIILLNGKFIL
ncbi:12367_t:CDS:2 [Dentiscutata erythropus]|uniref:12367_t:CDS:1 n=1 Tax=Dentiscutata erythropus TaxID=1348616 RepID=A0A9N9F0U8_9GLOM|nr:12367_t:CDS:2 [Dentiscutata erythropus]